MNKLLTLLIFVIIISCNNTEKKSLSESKEKSEKTIEKTKSKAETITKKKELTETEEKITDVALSFHNWYIKNTNDIKSKTPIDFVVTEGKNDNCIVDYKPYFEELRKLGTISNSFMQNEKDRTKLCSETISEMKWSEYIGVIPENCDDYLFWTRSQEETGGIESMNIEKINNFWKVKFRLFNTYGNQKTYSPYFGIITVEKENDNYMITEINWNQK